jgi:MarR family transcriptional regulator, lower aerobic nicotinate degradation pathway regulator
MMQLVNDLATRSISVVDACDVVAASAIPQGAQGRIAFLLVKVGTVLSDIADARLADSGLDARGYSILAILSVDGPGSQHELAQLIGKAPGVVVAEVDQLEERGFVERNRDPHDRRRSIVTLTEGGRLALERADQLAEATVAELFGGLDRDELSQLGALLVKGLALGSGEP